MNKLTRSLSAGVLAALALAASLVMPFEGERRTTYLDPVQIPTRCYGHTGKDVRLGQPEASASECQALLQADLIAANAGVDQCVHVPLTTGQRAALVSFVFNVGAGKFCGSGIAHKLNAGDYVGACGELSRWVWAGGKQLPGLVKRRAAERAVCEGRTPT
ncbi:lysozyme [Andreprevotia chitinilytica]|uniref:lysozyme n=1 Tax=Andreprevotia chitinilytica TaxID=396808 RepID=UPI00054F4A1C|nr:lysozyme [Andreprevotia chitinilytica]